MYRDSEIIIQAVTRLSSSFRYDLERVEKLSVLESVKASTITIATTNSHVL